MGALTSKPYAFTARPWELTEKENCDFNDFYSSPIRLDFRGFQLMRVQPSLIFSNSNEWISDRARFSYDAYQSGEDAGHLVDLGNRIYSFKPFGVWLEGFFLSRIFSLESSLGHAAPDYNFFKQFGYYSSLFGRNHFSHSFDQRHNYFRMPNFSSTGLRDRNVFFIGISLRYDHPVYSIQLRKSKSELSARVSFFSVGPYVSNDLDELNLGTSVITFSSLIRSKNRLSRVFYDNSVFVCASSSKLWQILHSSSVVILPSTSSEFDRCEVSCSQLKSFLSKVQSKFSTYKSARADFLFPVPHPFAKEKFNFSPSALAYSLVPSSAAFCTDLPLYKFEPATFRLSDYDLLGFSKDYSGLAAISYTYTSFYTHYTANEYLRNSKNILLNLKRNQDARYNYIYFLRFAQVNWFDFANAVGSCVYNFV